LLCAGWRALKAGKNPARSGMRISGNRLKGPTAVDPSFHRAYIADISYIRAIRNRYGIMSIPSIFAMGAIHDPFDRG
jgi:hypothetical protein